MYSIRTAVFQRLASRCPLCGLRAQGANLCAGCAQDLSPSWEAHRACRTCLAGVPDAPGGQPESVVSQCRRCEGRCPAFSWVTAALEYSCPADLLVQQLKERGRLSHAGLFARLLWKRFTQERQHMPQAIGALAALVPIPSSRAAIQRRGFNPAGEIARELSALSRISLKYDWLSRTREGGAQKTMGRADRLRTVEGLYHCSVQLPPCWIAVVDDVMTTGSTVQTAARALCAAGAQGVVVFTAAYTSRIWQNDEHD